jgi:hypothetical protein
VSAATATGALRSARAEAVAEQLAREGKSVYLADLRAQMRFKSLSKTEVDRAVDELAEAGRVSVYTTQHGGLVVKLRGAG